MYIYIYIYMYVCIYIIYIYIIYIYIWKYSLQFLLAGLPFQCGSLHSCGVCTGGGSQPRVLGDEVWPKIHSKGGLMVPLYLGV